ncbi:MAG TPA: class I adenylate-forming enzyme family protein [Candidatus Baltobacteraceae bacterium]|jgi:acyl-CoA synthetase (AMP-forming)/AMP-acid ligase II|nr:class I adenylate-forming enzyme family protein [Candidatus Baltobacteraceae bacterium]
MIPLDRLSHFAKERPSATALIASKESVTWRELAARVELAQRALFVHVGDEHPRRVVALVRNDVDAIVAFIACAARGISCIPLDAGRPIEHLVAIARLVQARAVLVAAPYCTFGEDLAIRANLVFVPLEALSELYAPAQPALARPFESIGLTSGTSGIPKVAYRTRSFDARRFAALTTTYEFRASDIYLVTVPFSHVSAAGWARMFLQLGGRVVVSDRLDAAALAEAAIATRTTAFLATPPTLEQMLVFLEQDSREAEVRFVISGGKRLSPIVRRRATEYFGNVIHEYYGTTETGLNVIAGPKDAAVAPRSAGRMLDGNRVLILDEHERPLPHGETGRVAIASYQMMDGYLGQQAPFTIIEGERFFVTADYGWLDEDDRLFLHGRKDVLGPSVTRDFPRFEDVVREVEGVTDVAFLNHDNRLSALVSCAAGKSSFAEITATLVAAGLPEADVRIVPSIPYSLSGKIDVGRARTLIADEEVSYS